MKKTPATDLAESLGILPETTPRSLSQVIIGKTFEEAINLIVSYKFTYRVVEKDGQGYMCTQDIRIHRLNLYLKDDVVYKANVG